MKTKLISALFAIAISTCATSAFAVPEYPPQMKGILSLNYEPPCSVCHIHGTTSSGTIETGFGVAMRARGLTGDDRASLPKAMTQMAADKVDTDGDGMGDIDELKVARDPNSPAPNALLSEDAGPQGGCAYGRTGTGLWIAVVALLARRRLSR